MYRNLGRKGPIRDAKRIVNKIVRVLEKPEFKQQVGIDVSEVFKGGSMGQGTAIPYNYDIDLVLYSSKWHELVLKILAEQKTKTEEDLTRAFDDAYTTTLTKIEKYLCNKLRPHYTLDEIGDVAVKFTCSHQSGRRLSVDLLLSPYFSSQPEFLQFLRHIKSPIERLRFSASASKWQTEFIRNQPCRVKELIRRAKAWRNVTWKHEDGKSGKPKSYLISLLVIKAYSEVDSKGAAQNFRSLASKVSANIKELVKEITEREDISLVIPGTDDIPSEFKCLLSPPPRIIDPANPSNNVYKSGVGPNPYGIGDGKWGTLRKEIANMDLTVTTELIMETATY